MVNRYIQPDWPAPACIKAYTTLRSGWGGRKPYHDINRGHYDHTNPLYLSEGQDLTELLKLPDEPIWLTQAHTNIALPAIPQNREQTADASFSKEINRVCLVLTADCLPILICSRDGTEVAAIHAGWRGLANGIIENTIDQLAHKDLLVWLGPAIGPQKFEVGKDVYDRFVQQHPASTSAFAQLSDTKWLANLYDLAKFRLNLKGIHDIYGGNFCTYSQEDLFFSYRRDKGRTGRMASTIWIAQK